MAFKITNAGSAFGMGSMCVALLIQGAIDANLRWYFIAFYCVCMIVWCVWGSVLESSHLWIGESKALPSFSLSLWASSQVHSLLHLLSLS